MINKVIFSLLVFVLSFAASMGQRHPADSLRIVNRSLYFKDGDGTPLITYLNSAPGVGIAWFMDKSFTKGIIEFDAKGKDAFQQSFVGIAFHGENDSVYEAIYFRPFNFKSADPARKLHAVQYIAMPQYDWPKLRSDYPNQYEKPVIPEPDPNLWFHVKIVVTSQKISVFVNNQGNPALVVSPLVELSGKMVGYWVGNGSDGDWKNLIIH